MKGMYQKCNFNGDVIDYPDFHIHISDLGIQRGYGVFDFFGIVDGGIKWHDDYLDRFFNSMSKAELEIPYTKGELEGMVYQIVNLNESPNSFIKLIATGGYSTDGFTADGEVNLLILNFPDCRPDKSDYKNGIALITHEFIRPNPEIKSLNYLTSAILQRKMKQFGATDVLYHFQGFVSETSRANVFIVKNEKLITTSHGILKGITRKHFIEKYENLLNILQKDIKLEDLFDADEVFITSTTKSVMPVVQVDNQPIGDGNVGKITHKILKDLGLL